MTELETPYTATAEKAAKTAVTRFYGARGADAFQEVEVALKGDLVALEGTHGIDLAPGDAAALGYRLVQLAKKPAGTTRWRTMGNEHATHGRFRRLH